jgi:hypothetical protein
MPNVPGCGVLKEARSADSQASLNNRMLDLMAHVRHVVLPRSPRTGTAKLGAGVVFFFIYYVDEGRMRDHGPPSNDIEDISPTCTGFKGDEDWVVWPR